MSGYSQFIYGKFHTWNSGYCLVACTPDLAADQEQLQSMAEKELRFWGAQPPEGPRRASGISEIKHPVGAFTPKDHLVLIQTEEADRASGGTSYTQQRYIFVPKTEIINEPLLLGRLYKLKIPVFPKEFKPNFEYFDPELLKYPKPENWESAKIEEIVDSLSDRRDAELPLLLAAIAILLDNRQLILTLDDPTVPPQKILENILWLLPAACSNSLAVALGTIDEARCDWANLVIKANGFPNVKKLPENSIWLNRKSRKFSSQIPSEVLQHSYVQDFLARIELNFDSIQRLQQRLKMLTSDEFTLDNLMQADTLIQIIPGLTPGKAQIECWTKYLPWSSNIKTVINQGIDRASLLCLWEALEQRYDNESEGVQTMLSLIQRLAPESVIEIFNRLFNHLKLAENLIAQGLFNISNFNDTNISTVLRRLCVEIIKNKSNIKQINEAWNLASSFARERDIFPSNDKQFIVLDAILCAEYIPENVLNNWLIDFGYLFACVNKEVIYDSNLFRKLDAYSSLQQVKVKMHLLLENPQDNLIHLPCLADAMEMNSTSADHLYHCFLANLSESIYISSLPLLHILISRSIERNPRISFNTTILPKTFYWFKQLEELRSPLTKLEENSTDWAVWYKFAEIFCSNKLEVLQYLDKKAQIFADFPIEMLQQWMQLIDNEEQVERAFLESHTYSELKPETVQAFVVSSKKREHIIRLATYFIRTEQLQRVTGSLLNFLCQSWLNEKQMPPQESVLWNLFISTKFNALKSSDYLQLIRVKWHLHQGSLLDLSQVNLTAQDRKRVSNYASELLTSSRDFQWGRNLIQDCYDLKLDKVDLQSLTIKLIIEASPTEEEIIPLLTQAKDWGLEKQEQMGIIEKVIEIRNIRPLFKYYVQLKTNRSC